MYETKSDQWKKGGAGSIAFVAYIERGVLEWQALLLFESIRRYAGAYAGAPLYAVSPRAGHAISAAGRRRLEELEVEHVETVLNRECLEYRSANRVLAAAHIEANHRHDTLVVLDSDTLFLREPSAFALAPDTDVAVRPVGVDTGLGSGREGPKNKDYHGAAVTRGGGTFAGLLHQNVVAGGLADRVALVVTDSITASMFFADHSLEWVHLDARHDHAGVSEDIAAWLPKIRSGGWLSGDDHDAVKWPGVVSAVAAALPGARGWSVGQWRWAVP